VVAENKTRPTGASVERYLRSIKDEVRLADCRCLVEMMSRVTGEPPRMWGASIVGFGTYHYRYDSGREGDFFLTGFSSRKADLSLYVMAGFGPASPACTSAAWPTSTSRCWRNSSAAR